MARRSRSGAGHGPRARVLFAAGSVLAACGGFSGGSSAQSLTVVPSASITETLTDNRDLKATNKQGDLITQISPGVSISSRRGALQGNLNYSANGLVHARDSELNTLYHNLTAAARLSAWEGRAGLDATAAAGRQVVSAFGTQVSDANLNTGNQVQTFSYSLAPYLSGRLLGDTMYRVGVGYRETRSGGGSIGDSASLDLSAGISGRRGVMGWSLDASRQISETSDRPRGHIGRVVAGLSYTPDVEWLLSARAGLETEDIRSGRSERTGNWGAGVAWSPGPRTSLRVDYDRRFFGASHSLGLSHRMARTIWTLSDSRSLNTGASTGRSVVSNYDLYFTQFASIEPDPVRRDALVRSFLAANGLNPGAQVIVGGFLSGGATVQRNQTAAVAYQGLRGTLTLAATRSHSGRVGGTAVSSGSDLAAGASVRQQGLSVSLSHRLTPDSSVVVSASQQRTSSSGSQAGNDLQTIVATWSARLGPHANASLGVRHSRFDSDANPYTESAVIGSIRMQF